MLQEEIPFVAWVIGIQEIGEWPLVAMVFLLHLYSKKGKVLFPHPNNDRVKEDWLWSVMCKLKRTSFWSGRPGWAIDRFGCPVFLYIFGLNASRGLSQPMTETFTEYRVGEKMLTVSSSPGGIWLQSISVVETLRVFHTFPKILLGLSGTESSILCCHCENDASRTKVAKINIACPLNLNFKNPQIYIYIYIFMSVSQLLHGVYLY